GRSRLASVQTIGSSLSPIGKDRHLCVAQQFHFANDSVAASKLAATAASTAYAVSTHAQRISELERFRGRVQRIGHVSVNPVDAIKSRPRAHSARNRFVVSELL